MARQKLGQHFRCDAGGQEKIARSIRVSRHSHERPETTEKPYCWIEVGAGHGEMTQFLVATRAPVYAVELDPPLIARLQERSEEHTSELQSRGHLVCRLLL